MKTQMITAAIAVTLAATLGGAAAAQQPPAATEVAGDLLAIKTAPAKGGAKLTVTTAFENGADIPFEYTQYQGNAFPGLTWSAGPAGTKSYAIIMHDSDIVIRGAPILHWSMYNIPANVTSLPKGMAPTANPAGSAYGPNYQGQARPYLGPRTPPGPKHRYHFQVFALDTTVPADPAITYASILAAMKDHVLASGETVGLGQVDPNAPPPPPRPAPPVPAAK